MHMYGVARPVPEGIVGFAGGARFFGYTGEMRFVGTEHLALPSVRVTFTGERLMVLCPWTTLVEVVQHGDGKFGPVNLDEALSRFVKLCAFDQPLTDASFMKVSPGQTGIATYIPAGFPCAIASLHAWMVALRKGGAVSHY